MGPFIFTLELIGTIAFAASGAIIGLKKRMDIFGVIVLGLTTAVGGGVLRDIILGITPPQTFRYPIYAFLAIATSMVIFIPAVRKRLTCNNRIYERMIFIMDTLGLGIFTQVGIQIAYSHSIEFNAFLFVFVGVITGVGGGVLRDILAGDTPFIFIKHIYASASLVGAIASLVLWHALGSAYAIVAGVIIIVVIRCVSAHFKLNLPSAAYTECEHFALAEKQEEPPDPLRYTKADLD